MELVATASPIPHAVLEHVLETNKKPGINAAAAAFIPSRPSAQAQTSIDAAAAHHTITFSSAAEPGTLVNSVALVAENKREAPAKSTADVAVKLRPEATKYLPVAKIDYSSCTSPVKVS